MTLELLTHTAAALGPAGIACSLIVLGRLSERMHETTKGAPVYRWFYVAAFLLLMSAGARLVGASQQIAIQSSWLWVLLYDGLPALGVLIGLAAAWRIWAWLLAERG